MPTRCLPLLALVLAGGPLAAQAPEDSTGALIVQVLGIRARQGGVLVVALYDRQRAWLAPDSALAIRREPVRQDSAEVVFPGLRYGGDYAVAVIHDRNGNDKLDMRWLPYPKPKEGSGVSNNRLRNGPPVYDPARVAVRAAADTIRITLRY